MNLVTFSLKRFVPFMIVLVFLILLSLSEAIRTQSVKPIVEDIGLRLLAADRDNHLLTEKALGEQPSEGFFGRFPKLYKGFLLLNVLLNLWFIYEVYTLLSLSIRFLFSIPDGMQSFPTAIIAIFILILFNVIAILYQGTQGFASWIPFAGTYHAFVHLDAFLW